jgi:hypothetical protein
VEAGNNKKNTLQPQVVGYLIFLKKKHNNTSQVHLAWYLKNSKKK